MKFNIYLIISNLIIIIDIWGNQANNVSKLNNKLIDILYNLMYSDSNPNPNPDSNFNFYSY